MHGKKICACDLGKLEPLTCTVLSGCMIHVVVMSEAVS